MAHKKRDPTKESFWRRQVRGQARSGMTVRAWCRNEQVNEATFHWWRRELARRDAEQTPSGRRGRPQARRNRQTLRKTTAKSQRVRRGTSSPAFVPVCMAEDGRDAGEGRDGRDDGGGRIEIVLTDGRCVRVTGSVDRQMLADVLAALEHPPC